MPTYDYICTKCGDRFEVFQSIKAVPKAECPKCGSPAKRQIGTGIGVIFKGTGFYQTDYKRKESGGGGDASKPKPKVSESKTPESRTSESKPSETKPSESKSSESKSSETKSSESKSSETKSSESKSSESKD
jgi:putative FmdB family regulatory protein